MHGLAGIRCMRSQMMAQRFVMRAVEANGHGLVQLPAAMVGV